MTKQIFQLLNVSLFRFLGLFRTNRIAFSIEDIKATVPIGATKLYEELNSGRLRAKKLGDKTVVPFWYLVEWLDNLPDYLDVK